MKVDSGESLVTRGIGRDNTPGCFVCGGEDGSYHNIAAFVLDKESGARIVAMFPCGAWLDYRPKESHWMQVKIGACDEHLPNLCRLNGLISNRTITPLGIAVSRGDVEMDTGFLQDVSVRAYYLWRQRELQRSVENWLDAGSQFMQENQRWSNQEEYKRMAERLHYERSNGQALQDWLDAEIFILQRLYC